jgi:membrane carboxypeptidase/penicillin-binding protein
MQTALRVSYVSFGVVALALAAGLAWGYFDTRGLPDTESLATFAPSQEMVAYDPCRHASSIAVPYESIGTNLRSAIGVAEASESGPGVIRATYRSFDATHEMNTVSLSMRIARSAVCNPSEHLDREARQFRFAIQLEQRFSRRELFTVFANRTYFGGDTPGVESASQLLFHKDPDQVSLSEAALIAGLARSPTRYSPVAHPDLAMNRRNQILDAMVQEGLISESKAAEAKSTPLGVVGH